MMISFVPSPRQVSPSGKSRLRSAAAKALSSARQRNWAQDRRYGAAALALMSREQA